MKASYVFYAHDSKLRGIGRLSCRCDQTPSLSPCDAATNYLCSLIKHRTSSSDSRRFCSISHAWLCLKTIMS